MKQGMDNNGIFSSQTNYFFVQKKDAGRKKEDDEGKITEEGGRWCDIDYVKIQLKSNDTWNA